jgi:hypothetical protein
VPSTSHTQSRGRCERAHTQFAHRNVFLGHRALHCLTTNVGRALDLRGGGLQVGGLLDSSRDDVGVITVSHDINTLGIITSVNPVALTMCVMGGVGGGHTLLVEWDVEGPPHTCV